MELFSNELKKPEKLEKPCNRYKKSNGTDQSLNGVLVVVEIRIASDRQKPILDGSNPKTACLTFAYSQQSCHFPNGHPLQEQFSSTLQHRRLQV